MKEDKNRKTVILILTISSILLVLGVTYAAFQYTGKGTKENTVTTGDVSFVYNETSNGVSITNALPMNDEKGKVLTDEGGDVTKGYFDFNVTSTMGGSTVIPYYVYAVDMTEEETQKLDPQYVKIYLTDQDETVIPGYEEVPVYADLDDVTAQEDGSEVKGKLLYQDTFYESGVKEFRLRMWVSDAYEVKEESEYFKMRVDVSTDAEITTNVKNKPTCTLEDYFPTKTITKDKTVELTISCTDTNEITKDLTGDGLKVTVGDEEDEGITKEVTNTESIKNGKKYTVEVKGFTKTGKIGASINSGVIEDSEQHTNEETPLNIDLSISNTPTENFVDKSNSTDASYSDETKHDMFEIEQPDGTTGYRYIGDDPYNYVQIDGESSLWRIIGVFNDPSSTGNTSKRIKLIRDESIGEYSWDNKTKGNGSNLSSDWGSNNWNDATLQNILNSGAYWKKENGTCSTGTTLGATKECDFSSTGLSTTLKGMIENMKWYLGGYDKSSPYAAEKIFTQERGSKPAGAPSSATIWEGKVGLMYASDYGFTYSKGVDSACESNLNDCWSNSKKGWIRNISESEVQWMLTPSSEDPFYVLRVYSGGYIGFSNAYYQYAVRPVVYLKSSIGITGGKGQKDNPYTIGEKTIKDLDLENPICNIESITPESPTTDDSVQIKINCTDDSKTVISKLNNEDIEVKLNEESTSVTKELSDSSPIEGGVQYTLTLNGFERIGSLSINIPANKIFDESGNSNIETYLTAGAIKGAPSEQNGLKSNPKDAEYNDDTKHDMFEIEQPDGTTGYRYIGNDPYNYVQIDEESSLWRIIGVFDDPVASGEQSGKKIKLIRDEPIGEYSWDNTTGTSSGSNNWTKSTLQNILNSGPYWNKENGTCSSGSVLGTTTACDFSTTGLSDTLKGIIAKMKWYLGGYDWLSPYSTDNIFKQERGSKVPSEAPSTWEGFVGLIYPSDYTYTYSKGVDDTCYNTFTSCSSGTPSNGWIFNNKHQWTITSRSSDSYAMTCLDPGGSVANATAASSRVGVRPAVYLKSNVEVVKGTGEKTNPYILEEKDKTAPVCSIESITPDSPTTEDEVQIKINCTDNSGKVTEKSSLTKEDIEVKLNGESTSVTKKLSNSSSIEGGIQYTLTLNGFENAGSLSLTIPANKIFDESGNSNIETSLTAGTIFCKNTTTDEKGIPLNSCEDYTSSLEDTKHNMYMIEQPDETTAYRYIGNDPYNYVTFNGENAGWRIIGVFEEENASGVKEKRIKLIKDKSIGEYSWDNNGGYGKNNWTRPAALNTTLNSLYWNSTSGSCPNGQNDSTTTCSFTSGGLKNSQSQIEKMKWYLGGYDWESAPHSTEKIYTQERGIKGDTETTPTTWNGYVGLMYASDYGYTYANGVDNICYNDEDKCYSNASFGWLFNGEIQWTLTPNSRSDSSVSVIFKSGYVYSNGGANASAAYASHPIHPVVYLKSTINITGGSGQKNDPYTIG